VDERQRAWIRGAESRTKSATTVGTVAGVNPATPMAGFVEAMATDLGVAALPDGPFGGPARRGDPLLFGHPVGDARGHGPNRSQGTATCAAQGDGTA
jgi:hypothetical protein